jgi:hypothetical protein
LTTTFSQPFARELAGRMHLFAHNGWLAGIFDAPNFRLTRFHPVGETDSEQAFCALLDRISELWRRPNEVPPLDARLALVGTFAQELRHLGAANLLRAPRSDLARVRPGFVQAMSAFVRKAVGAEGSVDKAEVLKTVEVIADPKTLLPYRTVVKETKTFAVSAKGEAPRTSVEIEESVTTYSY